MAQAAAHFTSVVARKYHANSPTYMNCVIGLALIALAQDDIATAAVYEQEARAFAAEANSVFLYHQSLACAVRVARAQGHKASMLRYAAEIRSDIDLTANIWLETPRICRVQALIHAADGVSLQQAERDLAVITREVQHSSNRRMQVAARTAQALLCQVQGRYEQALAELEQALVLAEPCGFVRTFLDFSPALQPLLRALLERGVCASYVKHLLADYLTDAPRAEHSPAVLPTRLPEMLTRRETEILALLAERWSNQEIAEHLTVSLNTVRKHTSTIYDKLGVGSRREAVSTARALGLLRG
ncbi:response regulator transcription factor [Candidatus Gracilibacteria bacterium]|nr:response regulator transcription factor [Candidatus Gracilibacteria bacterium]